ncbi:ribonuclease H-like domain-containing protein [Marinicrinis sediminis]|uniref:Ribonuclease H-like domain-containing protein n=1 Tax=Marinicrinis sediminis TaxID=1652465 RepID=A0ABW5RE16_9BACL
MSRMRDQLLRNKRKDTAPVEREETSGSVPIPVEGEETSATVPIPMESEESSTPVIIREDEQEWKELDAGYPSAEHGEFIVRTRTYPLHTTHGHYQLSELAARLPALSILCKQRPLENLEQFVFMDTETTGLGLGAGNLPFMIGVGFFQEQQFVIEQLLIRHPAEEPALLAYLLQRLRGRTHLVTYNGKSFDWPLIKNRFIIHRYEEESRQLEHMDALYPSRSLWKHVLESCRLSMVERERLGVSRMDDLPGSEAPAKYFEYLATKDPLVLSGVFHHNELDLLSLVTLCTHMGYATEGKLAYEYMGPEEQYRLFVWYDRMDLTALAEGMLERILSRELPQQKPYLGAIASYYKKQKKWELAEKLWKEDLTAHAGDRLHPIASYIELSKLYEHVYKKPDTALTYARDALEQWTRLKSATRMDADRQDKDRLALQKRIERLDRRSQQQAHRNSTRSTRSRNQKKQQGKGQVEQHEHQGFLFEL